MTLQRVHAFPFLLAALASIALLASCSNTPVANVDFKEDYAFSAIQKISFKRPSKSGDESQILISDMQINRIEDALARELERKGFVVVEKAGEADAVVHWHLITQEKIDVRTQTVPGAMTPYPRYNRAARYNCWNCGATMVDVDQYTEGTFILDIVDPAIGQSVWRSVTQSRLQREQSRDRASYDAAAGIVLANFPPGADLPD